MNKIDKKGLWLFIVATLVAFAITVLICLTVVKPTIDKQIRQTESILIVKPPAGDRGM